MYIVFLYSRETRLRAKCQQQNDLSQDVEQIPKTARALEQLLFKQSKNLRAYTDRSTMDLRLRSLMTVLVRRRMFDSAQRQRTQILVRLLGKEKYQHIQDLIREVRLTQMKQWAKLKCNSVVCAGTTFGENLPEVVRRLYFETTLLQCFEEYSVDRLRGLDWEMLIEQAQVNLRDFHTWEGEQEEEL
jgi:hypothetical protein